MELISYDLEDELFDAYSLIVKDILPNRKVYILVTDRGDKYLKKIDYNIKDLLFLYEGLNYVRKSFDRVASFLETDEGEIYTSYKGNNYIILNKIEGREGNFFNPLDIKYTTKALKEFHSASIGFRGSLKARNNTGGLIKNIKEKLYNIDLFYTIAGITNTEFSSIYRENYNYYRENIIKSLEVLENSKYFNLCKEEKYISINHHDMVHHNVIINDDRAYFIDFDYSLIDLRVHDICNFINKTIKNFDYDFKICRDILEEYNLGENNLGEKLVKEEIEVLYGMLLFPIGFYEISFNYFTRNKTWEEEEFIKKLNLKIDRKKWREIFLEEFQIYAGSY